MPDSKTPILISAKVVFVIVSIDILEPVPITQDRHCQSVVAQTLQLAAMSKLSCVYLPMFYTNQSVIASDLSPDDARA